MKNLVEARLKPVMKVAKTLNRNLCNTVAFCSHRVVDAVAEGLNRKANAVEGRVGN